MDINELVMEHVLGLQPVAGIPPSYIDPTAEGGFGTPCLNFLESTANQQRMRYILAQGGWSLRLEGHPANPSANRGRSSVATYTKGGRSFSVTRPDENEAVCVAALLTTGIRLPELVSR